MRPRAHRFPQRFPGAKGEVQEGSRCRCVWGGRAGGGLWGGSPCSVLLAWGRWVALGMAASGLQGKEGLSWQRMSVRNANERTLALFTGKNTPGWRIMEVKASCEMQLWFWEAFFEDVLLLSWKQLILQGGGNLLDCKGGSGGLVVLRSVRSPARCFCTASHVGCFCTRVSNFSMV